MIFNKAIEETTFWTKGGGEKTKDSKKETKFASKEVQDIYVKDYKKAIKSEKAFIEWIHKLKGTT